MCHMLVDCCGQNRTYEKFFGLTATRLCMLKREYMELFELIFVEQYETIHRLETNKLRNVAKVGLLLGPRSGSIKRTPRGLTDIGMGRAAALYSSSYTLTLINLV